MAMPRLDGLTSRDLDQRFLEVLAHDFMRVVTGMAILLQQAAPVLLRAAQTIERIEKLPPVEGYEAFLIQEGRHPLEARFLARLIIKLGKDLRQESLAERSLASAIAWLTKVEGASSLVISRRAKILRRALNEPQVEIPVAHARALAGVPEWIDSLKELVGRAIDRDEAACRRLVEISKLLRPHLRDPRGRIPSLASTRHELLLHLVNRGYTVDVVDGDITDAATLATRTATDDPDFDPRPARRRLRAREAPLGRRRAVPKDALSSRRGGAGRI